MSDAAFRFGEFLLDERRHELQFRGRPVRLAPQPFCLLATLVARRGELVSRQDLERALWGEGTFVDAEAGLNFCVRTVRRALTEVAGDVVVIETVPRLGYRLALEVVEVGPSPPTEPAPSASTEPSPTSDSAPAPTRSVPAERRLRAGAIPLAAGLAGAAAIVGLALVGSGRAERCDPALAVAVDSDGQTEAGSIARAFEAEVVEAVLEGAAGRGEVVVDRHQDSRAESRLAARIFAIPAGYRGEFRLLNGETRAVSWQWTVELSPERWFYGRSMIAGAVGRDVVLRLWPRGGTGPAAPSDAELAAAVERARRALDDRAGAGERALAELRPLAARSATSAEAAAVEARARLALWDRAGAERTARRALELDSDSAEAAYALALALSAQGRHREAVETAFRARKLAPLAPWTQSALARVLLFAGRPGEVVGASDAGLAIHPELMSLWRWRYLALVERGDFARAGEALARVARLSWGAGLPADSERALAEGATHDTLRAEWRAELAGAYGTPPATAASRAALHALLGESDAALAEIERAVAQHEESAVFFGVAPWFARLRGHARFQALVRRVESEGRS
jgi:DNA-binding winged helix-turn-helix (wHTH) protein/tetratricopeptide (TPR) repeat protein